MKRAGKTPPPAPDPGRRPTRSLLATLAALGLVAILLFGLWWLNGEARRQIAGRDRYAVRFADIRCDSPPGTTREQFLTEVRYESNAAPTIRLLSQELQTELTEAFASHPWVEAVESVGVEPPDAVSVKLTFRTPVLAVRTDNAKRAVDAKGILLPTSAPTDGLPELLTPVAAPGKAGQPWPDDVVIRAAPVAAEYRPKTLERTPQGWALIQPGGKKLIVGR